MPVAVVINSTVRKNLKTCPPDGYVVIRRMNYGESLKRRDMMASIAMQLDTKGNKNEGARMQMDLLQEKTSLWEFGNLIVEHNLTDANDRTLNFKNPEDIKMIEGRIGDEIQQYINELNSFEDSEEIKN